MLKKLNSILCLCFSQGEILQDMTIVSLIVSITGHLVSGCCPPQEEESATPPTRSDIERAALLGRSQVLWCLLQLSANSKVGF